MRKRALSLLLALLLALSLAPAASAQDGQAPQAAHVSAPEEAAPAHGSVPSLAASSSSATGWEEAVPYTAPASSAPQTRSSYGAAVDEDAVYRTLNSYRGVYPEGTPWTNEDNIYVLSVPYYDEYDRTNWTMTGYGCVAFCYELLDAAFDTPIAYKVYDFTYDDIRIGDCLRVDNDQHIVMVLEKYSDHVVLAEGNYDAAVHWDRTLTRAEVMQSDYIVTRYPKPAPASLELSVTYAVSTQEDGNGKSSPTSLLETSTIPWGGAAYIYIRSPMTSPYTIKFWRGAMDSAAPTEEAENFPAASCYWYAPRTVGLYTVYVETTNADGRLISGTTTFRVIDGSPSGVTVSTDRSSYALGETVTIKYGADNADSYKLSVWQGEYGSGTRVFSGDGDTAGRDRFKPGEAGTYTVYVEAVNGYGAVSAVCQFTVTGGAPSNVTLTVDRPDLVVGEPFNVSVTATDMTGFNVELWRGGYKTGVMEDSKSSLAPGVPIEVTLSSTAIYTLYVEAYNGCGTISATTRLRAVVNASSAQFADVPRNAYYASAVDWALKAGVTTGTSDTEFSPDDTLTRAQAVTFLWRAMGQPVPSASYHKFGDVYDSDYYYEAVQWAVENGVTNGVSDTEFEPYGSVTRGQMITFLWRALGRPGDTGQGEWYADAEYWARSNSLLTGTALIYTTDAGCPRGDVVYYMWNALA